MKEIFGACFVVQSYIKTTSNPPQLFRHQCAMPTNLIFSMS